MSYGTVVISRLTSDLKNELPDVKGFSDRNIGLMISFHRAYPTPGEILQQPVAKLAAPEVSQQAAAKVQQPAAKLPDSLLWSIPWGHHALLIAQVKDLAARVWYMQQRPHGQIALHITHEPAK